MAHVNIYYNRLVKNMQIKKILISHGGESSFLYGPYEYPTRLVPSVIQSLLKDEPAQCTHGNQIRDFLYVADVADAFVAILDSDVNGIINIGSGKPVSVKELVIQIARLLGKEKDIRLGASTCA